MPPPLRYVGFRSSTQHTINIPYHIQSIFITPPEIIGFNRIVSFPVVVFVNHWRKFSFVPPAPHQPVEHHHRSDEESVFLVTLAAVFGTGRIHWAMAPPNSGKPVQWSPVKLYHRASRIESAVIVSSRGWCVSARKKEAARRQNKTGR